MNDGGGTLISIYMGVNKWRTELYQYEQEYGEDV